MQGSTNLDIVAEPDSDDKNLPQHVDDDIEHDVSKGRVHLGATNEAAKQILEAGQGLEFSAADQKRVVRMIDWHVLLPMCLLYLSQQVSATSGTWLTFRWTRVPWDGPGHSIFKAILTSTARNTPGSQPVYSTLDSNTRQGTWLTWR